MVLGDVQRDFWLLKGSRQAGNGEKREAVKEEKKEE
jgi:hypothetical protein